MKVYGQGLDRPNDKARAAGKRHIIPAVKPWPEGSPYEAKDSTAFSALNSCSVITQ